MTARKIDCSLSIDVDSGSRLLAFVLGLTTMWNSSRSLVF
jgi:hypothetical protein